MYDCLAVVLLVVIMIVVGILHIRLRVVTSLTLGALVGALLAGVALGREADFDSPRHSERRALYDSFTLALGTLLALHFVTSTYREAAATPPKGGR